MNYQRLTHKGRASGVPMLCKHCPPHMNRMYITEKLAQTKWYNHFIDIGINIKKQPLDSYGFFAGGWGRICGGFSTSRKP